MTAFISRTCPLVLSNFGGFSRTTLSSTRFLPCQSFATAAPTTSTTSSPPRVHQSFELVRKTVGRYFDEKKTQENIQWNDTIRDVSAEARLTNSEYQKVVEAFANGFSQNYKIGDNVAVMLGVLSDSNIAFFSSVKAGVLPTFVDPDITVANLQKYMKQSQSKGLIFAGKYNLKDHEFKVLQFCPELEYWPPQMTQKLGEFPHLKHVHETGQPENIWAGRFFQLNTPVAWPSALPYIEKKLDPASDCLSILNQGRRLVFSHFSVLNNGRSVAHTLGLNRDRVASLVPVHTYGLIVGGVSCLESDSLQLFSTHDLILREDVLNAIQTEHATVIISPLQDLVDLIQAQSFAKTKFVDLRKVVIVIDGEEANELSLSKLRQVQEAFKVQQLDVLVGVREGGIFLSGAFTSPNSLTLSPLPHISVRVSASGQLQVQGYNVAQKFIDEKSSVSSPEGWLSTTINAKSTNDGQFQLSLQQ